MEKISYSNEVANSIKDFLFKGNWSYSFDEEGGIFRFGISLSGKMKRINYLITVKKDIYIVYAYSPLGVEKGDENIMARMAEYICRANYGLKNGNFELDMQDGEIRYKTYVNCEGIALSEEVIRDSIVSPAAAFERYGEGFVDIIFNDMSAKSAIEKCENS